MASARGVDVMPAYDPANVTDGPASYDVGNPHELAAKSRTSWDLFTGGFVELAQARFFPKVKDFSRDAEGNIKESSLSGPERLLAKQQIGREKLVALAELRALREEMRRCYNIQATNATEKCKDLVVAYSNLMRSKDFGALTPAGDR